MQIEFWGIVDSVGLVLSNKTSGAPIVVEALTVAALKKLWEQGVIQVLCDIVQISRIDRAVDNFLVVEKNAFLDPQGSHGCDDVEEVDNPEEDKMGDGLILEALDRVYDVGIVQVHSQQVFHVEVVEL